MTTPGPGDGGFRMLGEELLYAGSFVSVMRAGFAGPDGGRFERDIVRHPGAVVIVPVLDGGESVLLVRQYRAPIGTELLELPAGKRDVDGEPPEETAVRELAEEVGMQSRNLALLGTFFNSPGFSDELSHVFAASGLTACARSPQGPEERQMRVETASMARIEELVRSGAIADAKTIVGLFLAREALASGRIPAR